LLYYYLEIKSKRGSLLSELLEKYYGVEIIKSILRQTGLIEDEFRKKIVKLLIFG